MMGLFDRDYDSGYRTGAYGRYDRDFGSNRNVTGYRGATAYGAGPAMGGYDRTYRGSSMMGAYDRDYYAAGTPAYDRGYNASAGYDRDHKSRWETDYGDPYGDRTSNTPIRMMRGEFEQRYDRAYRGYDRGYRGEDRPMYSEYDRTPETGYRNAGYREGGYTGYRDAGDRGYSGNARGYNRGVGHDPYYGRGYDSGWF